jgi:hypothetical protein
VTADFIGNGRWSRRHLPPPGKTLTEASHRLKASQQYVRVVCQDFLGRWAWSNPLFLNHKD